MGLAGLSNATLAVYGLGRGHVAPRWVISDGTGRFSNATLAVYRLGRGRAARPRVPCGPQMGDFRWDWRLQV